MASRLRVVVCGGGNAAHILVPAIKEASGAWVGILAPYGDEATRFSSGASSGGIVATYRDREVCGVPDMVTPNPGEIIPSADIVILALPAFAHQEIVDSVAPLLKRGAWLGAMPSRSGFEFYSSNAEIRDKGVVLFGFQTLPWACRIAEYGKRVSVMGQKLVVGLGTRPAGMAAEVSRVLQETIGIRFSPVESMLTISLGNVGQIIHPGIMYGLFKGKEEEEYEDGAVPPFYQSVNDETADILGRMSDEVIQIARALSGRSGGRLHLREVVGLKQWLLDSYSDQIRDASTLRSCFVTNSAYAGLKAPVVRNGSRFKADFKARYLTEDVPFGLVVTKGVGDICGVPTPVIDEVVVTTSRWIGAEYFMGGKAEGRDIGKSRHPRNFGVGSVDGLVGAGA